MEHLLHPSIIAEELARLLGYDRKSVEYEIRYDIDRDVKEMHFRSNGARVAVSFTSADLAMKLDDFSDRYLLPIVSTLKESK